ncbi:glycosyltransferase family 4 protein [Escherichia coli]|nr:glycosyltransferase family 4 protein [Escherichia coli]
MIDVICIDWGVLQKRKKISLNNINIYNVPALGCKKTSFLNFFIKWGGSSLYAALLNFRVFFKRHDLVISFSPCASSWFAIILGIFFSKKSLLIYWDFFPIHQVQIDLIKGRFKTKILKCFEKALVKMFDYIGCMSKGNCEFFVEYFKTRREKVFELPIWSEGLRINGLIKSKSVSFMNSNSIYFVFGGQIDYGRGIECILSAAKIAHKKNNKIKTIIIGRGRLVDQVIKDAESIENGIIYSDFIPRNDYLTLVSVCRAGLIATVPNVSVPTYPSKCLDYMKLSIPIIASIEDTTDFGEIIINAGAGLCCNAGDSNALAAAMLSLAEDELLASQMGEKANLFFKNRHEVKTVVNNLLEHIKED